MKARFEEFARLELALQGRMAEASARQREALYWRDGYGWNRPTDEEISGEIRGYARALVDLRAIYAGDAHAA